LQRGLRLAIWVLLALALVSSGLLWQKLDNIQIQLARQSSEAGLSASQALVTARQAQDMAWDQASVSVWDLEQVEEEAHAEGKLAVWEDEAQAQMARQDSAMRKKAIDTDYQR
jgi:hypothetical protein